MVFTIAIKILHTLTYLETLQVLKKKGFITLIGAMTVWSQTETLNPNLKKVLFLKKNSDQYGI
jgi:hypothetical protein